MFGNKCKALLLLLALPVSAGEPNIASYKAAEMVWLGSADGVLVPFAEEVVLANAGRGTIEFFVKNGEHVKARETWAQIDRHRLKQREVDFALAEKQLQYDLSDLDEKYRSEEKKHRKDIQKLEEQIRELSMSKRLPEARTLEREIDKALAELRKEMDDVERKHTNNCNPEKLKFEKEKLQQALQKKRIELRDYRKEKQFKASIGGRLEYLLPDVRFLEGSETEAEFKAGEPVAIIRDDSEMLVVVSQKSLPLSLHKRKSYMARVTTMTGAGFTAYYLDSIIEHENGKPVGYYRFRVREVDLGIARNSSGQQVVASVSETFKQKAYIVPKSELLEHDADLVQAKGWIGAALTLWPDYEVISEGVGSLALVKKKHDSEEAVDED